MTPSAAAIAMTLASVVNTLTNIVINVSVTLTSVKQCHGGVDGNNSNSVAANCVVAAIKIVIKIIQLANYYQL